MAYDFNSLTKQAAEATNRDGFYTDFENVDPSKLHQITELTEWLRTKAKGSDVREIIAQLFERTWVESVKEGNANMEVAQARGTYPNLRSRLDEADKKQRHNTAQLAQKANKDEVTNVMTPKGTLAYASLPKTGNSVGWYYYCPDGDGIHGAGNYVWNGTSWYFGGTGDEGYNLLKEDLAELDYMYDTFTINLFNANFENGYEKDFVKCGQNEYSKNGVVYTISKDKRITINNLATKVSGGILSTFIPKETESYSFYGCPIGGDSQKYYTYVYDISNGKELARDYGEGVTVLLTKDIEYGFGIIVRNGYSPVDVTFSLMLVKGTEPYEKYVPFGMPSSVEYINKSLHTFKEYVEESSENQLKRRLSNYNRFKGNNIYTRLNGNVWEVNDSEDHVLNPIIPHDCADPTVVKFNGYFYLLGTGKIANNRIPIYRSKDLANWTYLKNLIPANYEMGNYTFWAPDANIINGKIVVYVSKVVFGNGYKMSVVAFTANSFEEDFTESATIVKEFGSGGPVKNAIDPEYAVDTSGIGYIYCGSRHNIVRAQLSEDGLSVVSDFVTVARDLVEGTYIYKYGDYYYMFLSMGTYDSTEYSVGIARSKSLTGDFVNKDGNSILAEFPTTILKSSDSYLWGSGHNGEIIVDEKGDMYIFVHAHCDGLLDDEGLSNTEKARLPFLMRIVEGSDGWLAFADKNGNVVTNATWETSVPYFKKKYESFNYENNETILIN